MKICTIVGNRPQFIKEAPVSLQLAKCGIKEVLIHTGQHYDANMSDVFFDNLELPKPDYHFSIIHRLHGAMTGEILTKIEEVLIKEQPDYAIIYGDTNSTLAGALAAVKLHIPVMHIEAGVRIYDITAPEEVNRVLASHITTIHCCCTQHNVDNLKREGITKNVYLTGDVMLDAFKLFSEKAKQTSNIIGQLDLEGVPYVLMTFHRPENIDSKEGCLQLIKLIKQIPYKIVFPIHPRTKNSFTRHGLMERLKTLSHLIILDPIPYLDTINLINNCAFVVTDSGGLQREAFFVKKYCYFFYFDGCWPELEEIGWQTRYNLSENLFDFSKITGNDYFNNPFGDGNESENIVWLLKNGKNMSYNYGTF